MLDGFYRFTGWVTASPYLRRYGARIVVAAILFAPSIWMLSVIPPLWRDVDAVVQVAYPPGPGTILQYGPVYPFVARVPLYVGYAADCFRTGAPMPKSAFFVHPIFTDSGILCLLTSQHVALCCAAFYLITLTSRLFWIRLILAVVWAANPLFYTFAHSVGSETLGMILLLLIGALGLRIIRRRRRVSLKEWLLLGIVLWLSILSRHINATLAGLMPLAFLISGTYHSIRVPFAPSSLLGRWRRLRAKQALQKAIVAVAVGIGCIVLANLSLRASCWAVGMPYHSRVGFTFLFRLKFLAELPSDARNKLLDEVTKHATSADVKQLILLLRDDFSTQDRSWDVMGFVKKARESLFTQGTDPQGEQFILLLNRTEWVFLYPPNKIFWEAVTTDYRRSQEMTIPWVTRQLFASTIYLLSVPEVMPAVASLWTFRGRSSAEIMAVFEKHPYYSYFRHPTKLRYSAFLVLWAVNLALLAALARMRKEDIAAVVSYSAALILVGLFMMLANCVLNEFQPRYTLPMWELTIVSSCVLLGKTIAFLFPLSLSLVSWPNGRYRRQNGPSIQESKCRCRPVSRTLLRTRPRHQRWPPGNRKRSGWTDLPPTC